MSAHGDAPTPDGGLVIDLRDHGAPAGRVATLVDPDRPGDRGPAPGGPGPDGSGIEVVADAAPPAAGASSSSGAAIDEVTHRRWRIGAVVALIVLNALDLLTTHAFLEAGVPEANPIAAAGLAGGWVGPLKAALLGLLLARVLRRQPRIGSTCAMWFVTGLYTVVVFVNYQLVRAVGGTSLRPAGPGQAPPTSRCRAA
jgi:hypothetical protein